MRRAGAGGALPAPKVAWARALTRALAVRGAGGELQQVVRFLRQEKEVATVELRLAQHELTRLRSDLAVAQRAVLEANAQARRGGPRGPSACVLACTLACMPAESEGRPAARRLPWPDVRRGEALLPRTSSARVYAMRLPQSVC